MQNRNTFTYCAFLPKRPSTQIQYWAAIVVLIAGASYITYSYILNFWWSHDDTAVLQLVIKNSPVDYLFSPEAYQKVNKVYFVPLQQLVFDTIYELFGQHSGFFNIFLFGGYVNSYHKADSFFAKER